MSRVTGAGLTGDWRLVGPAILGIDNGKKITGFVWHEDTTGQVQIWRTEGTDLVDQVTFDVDPSWILHAVGDINGDQISDFIWTNDFVDLGFFWIMNAVNDFPSLSGLATHAADLLRDGQFMSPMPLAAGSGLPSFRLVAADQFDVAGSEGFIKTGREQGAVDLVWRANGGDDTVIWEMSYLERPCTPDLGTLMFAVCSGVGNTTHTFELSRNGVVLEQQPSYWDVVGTGDYNLDGAADIAWHARNAGAFGTPDFGHVSLWLSRSDGTFDPVTVTDANGVELFVDPTLYVIGGL